MKKLISMRHCYAYSNMPPREKSLWMEYKQVRQAWANMGSLIQQLPEEKPRYRWDQEETRWRPQGPNPRVVWYKQQEHKLGYRMVELAQYLLSAGYLVPEFTKDQLSAKN